MGQGDHLGTRRLNLDRAAIGREQQGEVVAVGPGRWSDDKGTHSALDISVGDTVLYSKYGGTEVTIDGDDLLILTSRDVLAIVTK